jgi:hypothetical protein
VALHFSEEEYAELLRRRTYKPTPPERLPQERVKLSYSDEITVFKADVMGEKPKRTKYGNRKVEIDGMKFDSQHEADIYFGVLLPSWKSGTYKLLARQVPFDLPGGIKYIADFVTVCMDGHVTVIDAKSEATRKNRVYINKKKQMRAIWHIEITEV